MTDLDPILDRKFRRGDFLKLAAATGGSTLLAACGASTEEGGGGGGGDTGDAGGEAAPQRPSIEEENGNLRVFEWAGYEIPAYGGLESYTAKYPKPKYSFLTSDDHALARVRGGFKPDLTHPCVGYVQDWVNMGAIEPFDTSLISNFGDLNPTMVEGGQIDGKQYFIPGDWGFSAPLYRADKVEPDGEESWGLFYDERYKGRISWWESPLENFVVAGYFLGVDDPWNMDDEQLNEVKEFLISKKHLVRNFWSSQTDFDADLAAGNIWIGYAWAGSYVAAKEALPEAQWTYSQPKEGRLSWVCGFVLNKDAENYHHAHEYVDAWSSEESAEWLIVNYAYGHANTKVSLEKVDPEFVELLHLDDPSALEDAHMDRYVDRRKEYARAWDEVKAA